MGRTGVSGGAANAHEYVKGIVRVVREGTRGT